MVGNGLIGSLVLGLCSFSAHPEPGMTVVVFIVNAPILEGPSTENVQALEASEEDKN